MDQNVSENSGDIIPGLFCAPITICFGIMYYISRLGLEENSFYLIIKTVGLGLLIILTPSVVMAIKASSPSRNTDRWYVSHQWLYFLILVICLMMGYIRKYVDSNIFYVVPFVGIAFLIMVLGRNFKSFIRFPQRIVLVLSFFFSLWLVCVYWGFEYFSPLFREKLVSGACAHRDTLFHSSISSMLDTYGISSTGLDGLVTIPYHVFSHYVVVLLGKLINIDIVTIYNLGVPSILIPLFFYTFVLLVRELGKLFYARFSGHKLADEGDWKYWLVFFALFLNFIPYIVKYRIFHNMTTGYSYILSPSYLVALVLSFILFGITINVIKSTHQDKQVYRENIMFIVFALPLLYVLISLSKLSFLYLIGGMYGYFVIRLKLYKYRAYVISLVLCCLAGMFVYKSQVGPALGVITEGITALIAPLFDFSGLRILDHALSCLSALAYIGLRVYSIGIKSFRDLLEAVKNRTVIDIELLFFLIIVSYFPPFPYFSDFQNFIAYALILANYNNFYYALFKNKQNAMKGYFTVKIFKGFVICLASLLLVVNYLYPVFAFVGNNLSTRKALYTRNDVNSKNAYYQEIFSKHKYAFPKLDLGYILGSMAEVGKIDFGEIAYRKESEIIDILNELSNLPVRAKRESALYIPKSLRAYWELQTDCSATPFIGPALSGLAMIEGLPLSVSAQGCITDSHGYIFYWDIDKVPTVWDMSPEQICNRAISEGFNRVIRISDDCQSGIDVETLECR